MVTLVYMALDSGEAAVLNDLDTEDVILQKGIDCDAVHSK